MSIENRRIWIIDNSHTVRTILRIALRRAGFQALCFEDGISALRQLRSSGVLPDLILLDSNLAGWDGYSLALYLRRVPALSGITIVMLSTSDGVLDRIKGRLAGANAYLTKPFLMREVVQTICQLLSMVPDCARNP